MGAENSVPIICVNLKIYLTVFEIPRDTVTRNDICLLCGGSEPPPYIDETFKFHQ